jgi:hypothetical protein
MHGAKDIRWAKASLVRAASRNLPAQLTNVAKLGVRPTGACMNMPRRGWIYGPKVEVQQPAKHVLAVVVDRSVGDGGSRLARPPR